MGYNLNEFMRVLPAAIGRYRLAQEGEWLSIRHPDNNHHLRLRISPLPDRMLGLIRIQHSLVEFNFAQMDSEERARFMQQFDRHFQRGGG